MRIIDFQFAGTSANISLPSKATILPLMAITVDDPGSSINLHFTIVTPGINLKIEEPDLHQEIDTIESSFRRKVTFVRQATGQKKDFTLQVTASSGTRSKSDTLSINYN